LPARYLRETITYGLDDALQAGAQAYFDGLAQEGIIARAPRLRLFASPAGTLDGPAAPAR
jgi:hypothetical protein